MVAAGGCKGLEAEDLLEQEEDKDPQVPTHLMAEEGTEEAMEAAVRI